MLEDYADAAIDGPRRGWVVGDAVVARPQRNGQKASAPLTFTPPAPRSLISLPMIRMPLPPPARCRNSRRGTVQSLLCGSVGAERRARLAAWVGCIFASWPASRASGSTSTSSSPVCMLEGQQPSKRCSIRWFTASPVRTSSWSVWARQTSVVSGVSPQRQVVQPVCWSRYHCLAEVSASKTLST